MEEVREWITRYTARINLREPNIPRSRGATVSIIILYNKILYGVAKSKLKKKPDSLELSTHDWNCARLKTDRNSPGEEKLIYSITKLSYSGHNQ